MPSHYLKHCWNIVNWVIRNKWRWNLNPNSYIFIQENAFENDAGKTAAVLSRPQCVKIMSREIVNKQYLVKLKTCLMHKIYDNIVEVITYENILHYRHTWNKWLYTAPGTARTTNWDGWSILTGAADIDLHFWQKLPNLVYKGLGIRWNQKRGEASWKIKGTHLCLCCLWDMYISLHLCVY